MSDNLLELVALRERIDKLERQALEHWLLIAMLFQRSGLDEAGISEAFTFASRAVDQVAEELADKVSSARRATPEGMESHQKAEEQHRERLRQLWREECRERGKIDPDPTAT